MPSGFRKEGGFSGVTFQKGLTPWNKGIPVSIDTKKKISLSLKGKTAWNKKVSNVIC